MAFSAHPSVKLYRHILHYLKTHFMSTWAAINASLTHVALKSFKTCCLEQHSCKKKPHLFQKCSCWNVNDMLKPTLTGIWCKALTSFTAVIQWQSKPWGHQDWKGKQTTSANHAMCVRVCMCMCVYVYSCQKQSSCMKLSCCFGCWTLGELLSTFTRICMQGC